MQSRRKTSQLLIGPGGGNSEARVNQQNHRAAQSRKKIECNDFFSPTGCQRRLRLQKKWNVRTQCRGQLSQLDWRQRLAKKFIQPKKCGGCVTAAAAQTGGQRNRFFQVNTHTL